jgi:hypothetical protein
MVVGRSRSLFDDVHQRLFDNGYSPLPIVAGTKRPACRRWSDACVEPLEPETRDRLARHSGGCGIGVALGFKDVVAIDVDVEDRDIVTALQSVLRRTPVMKRGHKGGTGFYRLRGAASRRFRDRDNKVLVELLARGCQKVIPPSLHPATGRSYEWIGTATLFSLHADELPELPGDITNRIEVALSTWLPPPPLRTRSTSEVSRPDRYLAAVIQRRIDELSRTPEGGRNAELNAAAYRLARLGVNEEAVLDILAPVALQIGLGEFEIARTVHSACKAGIGQGARK